jgi:cohesin complex subunit SA-1/2
MLFSSKPPNALPAAKTCTLMMPDELQHRLGGAFAAAAERYASDLEDNADETDEEGE